MKLLSLLWLVSALFALSACNSSGGSSSSKPTTTDAQEEADIPSEQDDIEPDSDESDETPTDEETNDDASEEETPAEPAPDNVVATGSLTISGTARVNRVLTAQLDYSDENGAEQASLAYQWYADDVAIFGQVFSSITLADAQLSADVYVQVSFTDDDGFVEGFTSESLSIFEDYKLTMVIDTYSGSIAMGQSDENAQYWGDFNSTVTTSDSSEHYYPSIAADDKGNLIAVTQSISNANYGGEDDIVYSYSHDNGKTWSDIALLVGTDTSDSESDEYPSIATDKNGTWVVVWQSDEDYESSGTDTDIMHVVSIDNGQTWSQPKPLNPWASTDSASDAEPKIAISGDNWVLSWHSRVQPDGSNGLDDEVYTMYTQDGGLSWSTPKVMATGEADDDTRDAYVQIELKENGKGVVVWSAVNNGSDTDIYGAYTEDFGVTWSGTFEVNNTAASNTDADFATDVMITTEGSLIVTWYGKSAATGSDMEVWLAYSKNNGLTWSDPEVLSVDPTYDSADDYDIQVLEKPSGGFIASWVDGDDDKIWISESDDLDTWSLARILAKEDSEEKFAWIIH